MADKGFGVKEINLIGASGVPTIESPNNLNLNAVNVAISTDVSIGATCTASKFVGALGGWILGNDASNHYTFTGPGLTGTVNDPDINLVRGQKYIFHNRSSGHPFRIQSTVNGNAGTQYNTGVTNNDGAAPTDIIFEVPQDAPSVLYYQCTAHPNMGGRIIIEDIEHNSSNSIGQIYNITVTASNTSDYTLNGTDRNGIVSGNDPTVTLSLGDTVNFNIQSGSSHPFYVRTGNLGSGVVTPPVTGTQGATSGTVGWKPTQVGTNFVYQCGNHTSMVGSIHVTVTNYTLTASDIGKILIVSSGTVSIPNNTFEIGQEITIINDAIDSGNVTSISRSAANALYVSGSMTNYNARELKQAGRVTLTCIGDDRFVLSPETELI
tara:strand:- start:714 stop:1850 length:1137 start_codon:yes stop_codon:yes gene_type:complete